MHKFGKVGVRGAKGVWPKGEVRMWDNELGYKEKGKLVNIVRLLMS